MTDLLGPIFVALALTGPAIAIAFCDLRGVAVWAAYWGLCWLIWNYGGLTEIAAN